jgi:hypothetical protein
MTTITKRKPTKRSLLAQINGCKKRIAAERDKLRELIGDAQSIAECSDDAVSSLECAADTLSEYL